MAIEIKQDQLNYTCDKCNRQMQYISDCDIIVPDSKPDMLKILEVQAMEQINEKSISGDYITIGGVINYNILYVGEGEETLQVIEYPAQFTQQISAVGADDSMMCRVRTDVVHVEHSIHNSRKLNVKCALDINANLYSTDGAKIVTSIDADNAMPARTASVNTCSVSSVTEHVFHVDEVCSLPEHQPAQELLRCSAHISNTEFKTVVNKGVIKGNLDIRTLYLCNGEICISDNEIPFTQIIDADTIGSDMYTTADFKVKNLVVTRELDNDATMSKLNVSADVCVCLMAFDEKHIDYVSDVYSPDYKIGVHTVDVCVEEMVDSIANQCIVSDTVRVDDGSIIEKVCSLTALSHADDVNIKPGSITVGGSANVVALCKTDGDGGMTSAEKQIPFTCTIPVSRDFDEKSARCEVKVDTEHSSYNLSGADSLSVRLVVKVCVRIVEEHNVSAVADIEYDESAKIDKTSQAGITVYFVQQGDEIWDIAKRYNTTIDEISSVNKLDDTEHIVQGKQLLIPKRS